MPISIPSSPQGAGDGRSQYQPFGGCLAFLVWSFGGSLLLFCSWTQILRAPTWTLSIRDAVYWATVIFMLAARHLSVVRYPAGGESGKSSTPADFRRYASVLLAIAICGWILAQAIRMGEFNANP
ncbi:MAG: hypothetical protein ABIP42_05490 [Planctomycetota bacterium]